MTSAPRAGDLLTPEAAAVLRTAVAEYRAGHYSDNRTPKDPQVQTYKAALYEHYQAVLAYIRTLPKETPPHA
jgi:hypothetical protein